MTAALVSAAATALAFLLNAVLDWIKQAQAQRTGAQIQAGADAAARAAATAAVAQAQTNAPRTQGGIVDSLNGGTF